MNHKFKVGDIVRCVSDYAQSKDSDCKNKIGKIIYIDKNLFNSYIIEFFEYVNGHDGWKRGKDGYCWHFLTEEIKLYDPILKTFLKEKNDES